MTKSTGDGRNEFRQGWPSLAASFVGNVVGVHALPPYTIGLFLGPLSAAFGWSRTAISFGVTVTTIGVAVSAVLTGVLLQRFDERLLLGFSTAAVAVGYGTLSLMGPSLTQYWLILAVIALLGGGCSPVVFSRLIVEAFDSMRGTALGIALLGTGLTATLVPVLLGPVIVDHGWRTGYRALAIVMLVSLPLMLGLLAFRPQPRHRPRAFAFLRIDLRLMLRDRVFVGLLLAFFCMALAIGGTVVHFVSMLADAGFAPETAASIAGTLGIALIAGRIGTGILIDRIFAPHVAAVFSALAAIGFLALIVLPGAWIPAAAVLVGLTLGSELDLIAFLNSRYFRFTTDATYGLLYGGFLCGVAISPVIYAVLRDRLGSYAPSYGLAALLLAAACVLYLRLPAFRHAKA